MTNPPASLLPHHPPADLLLRVAIGRATPEECDQVALAARRWAQHGPITFERAIGFRPQPGKRSRKTQAALSRRDILVRSLAVEFFAGRPASAAAAIHKAWSRYASSAWPRERLKPDLPGDRIGKPEEAFWKLMRLQDHVLSARSIRSILAKS